MLSGFTLSIYSCKYLFIIFDNIFLPVEEQQIYQTNLAPPPKADERERSLHKCNSRSEVLSAIKMVEIKYSGFRGGRGYFLLGDGICFEDRNDLGRLGFEKHCKYRKYMRKGA